MQTDLPDLHIFARVAESESFREAAEYLRMSRSTVSIRIGQLEKELGVSLFNRSTRRISLTDAGQTLYEYWETIASTMQEEKPKVELDQVQLPPCQRVGCMYDRTTLVPSPRRTKVN